MQPDIPVEVDTARLEASRTDTVKELPGYPVQNSPSGGFRLWGGTVGSGGVVYDIVWMGRPRRKPWTILRTPVCFLSYRPLSPMFQFSLSAATLVYLSQCSPTASQAEPPCWASSLACPLIAPEDQVGARFPCQKVNRILHHIRTVCIVYRYKASFFHKSTGWKPCMSQELKFKPL
jgi:hypothetical protein